jgi:hypothetical protein
MKPNSRLTLVFALAAAACSARAQCLEWTQLSNPSRPANWGMELVYDRARHVAVGLMGSHPQLTDRVVLYQLTNQGWSAAYPFGSIPLGPRFQFGSCYHPGRQTVLLFGGYTGIGGGAVAANDFWEWDGFAWHQIQHAGPWPPATGANFLVYDPGRQRVIMLGDDPNPTGLWSTWEWTGSVWEQGPTLGPIFNARYGVSFCFDEFRRVGFVYCIQSDHDWQQIWEYAPGATAPQGVWTQVIPNEPPTTGSVAVSMVYDPYRRLIIRHGGRPISDLYWASWLTLVWDPVERLWTNPTEMSYAQRRAASGVCYDTDLDRVILYGGARYDSHVGSPPTFVEFDDTWVLTNQTPGLVVDLASSAQWCPGQAGVLSVSIAGSGDIQWYKDSQPISGATSSILVINPVTAASAGTYECLVTNACGGIWSRPCNAQVLAPPAITSQPIGQDRCPGQNVLIVGPGVTGSNPQINLQWDNFGFWMNVPFQYNPVGNFYILPNAQNNQTGRYRFEVSNSCGTVYSEPFHIQVGVTFTQQTQSVECQPCQAQQFSVTAQGVGPTLSYAWQRDGVPLIDDGRIIGAATASLTINGVRYEDEGQYQCVVTDACESRATGGAYLVIPAPPPWVQRASSGPARRAAWSTDMVYDEARGVCVLFGGWAAVDPTTMSYAGDTWEWDGIEWTRRYPAHNPDARFMHKLVYDSLRSKVLLFGGRTYANSNGTNEVWEYDGTDWRLLTTSSGGPPVGAPGDAAFDPASGKMVVPIPCACPDMTWTFDPVTLGWDLICTSPGPYGSAVPLVYDGVLGTILGTTNSSYGDTWRYSGTGWAIIPNARPARTDPAVAFDAFRGRATMFGCYRSEYYPLLLSLLVDDTYTLTSGGWTLLLPQLHANAEDRLWPAGMAYDTRRKAMVVVGNTYNQYSGMNPMQTWEYRYVDKIVFDRQPQDRPLTVGATTQFRVRAAGFGTLTYQWRKGTAPLANGPTPSGSVISGADTDTLTISNTTAADTGSYSCLVANACGDLLSDVANLGSICYGNCDGSTNPPILNVLDFSCFLNRFAAGDPWANCDHSTSPPTLNVLDFSCFLNSFAAGCP